MPLEFPSLEADAEEVLAYQKAVCSKFGSVRNLRVLDYEDQRLYPAGFQWLKNEGGSDPLNTPFREPREDDDMSGQPMPVLNRIAPILDAETARLVSSAAQPEIIPNDRTTRIHRSARLSEQVLLDILDEANWVEMRQQDRRNALQYGTALIATGLELDFDNLENVPADVFACKCGWTVASKSAKEIGNGALEFEGEQAVNMIQNGIGTRTSPLGDPKTFARLSGCPECGGELKQRVSTEGDGGVDAFGEELFEEAPNHKAFVRVHSVYDFFPTGNGRSKHGDLSEYTMESIVSLDWLLKRHKHATDVKPLSLSQMSEMARWHPSGVEYGGLYGFSGWSAGDQARWCVYRVTVREPFKNDEDKAEPLGRLIISANDIVLSNGPLMIEHKETKRKIPRYKLHIGRFTTENDSCYGTSLVSRLLGSQDTVNNMTSMMEYNAHTYGSPRLHLPPGTTIEYLGSGAGAAQSDVFQWNGEKEPEVIQGNGQHPDATKLIELNFENMERAAGQSDVDRGQAPPGVSAASAMMFLGEQSGASKKPTEERFAERDAKIFRHMLEIVNATYDTPRQLKAGDRSDHRTQESYSASDLLWQLDVRVAVKPSYNTEVFNREVAKELATANLMDMNTPLERFRAQIQLGADESINPAAFRQKEIAGDEWLDFMFGQPSTAPVVKAKYDDHAMHEFQHLDDLESADGKALTRHWNMVQLACEGWEEQLQALQQAEVMAQTAMPPQVVKNPIDGKTDPIATKASAEAWAFGIQAREIVDSMPKNNEQRIFLIMSKLMAQYPDFLTLDEESAKDSIMLVRFLAHIEAHRFESAKAQAAAMMAAMPPQPSPAGPATPGQIPAANPKNPYN